MMTVPQAFFPQSVAEYMALQLAKKLGDTDRLSEYLSLFERHSLALIEESFTKATARLQEDLVMAFEEELAALIVKGRNDEL